MHVDGMSDEGAVFAGDAFHPRVLADIERVMVGDAAVIFERFNACRLFRRRNQRPWQAAPKADGTGDRVVERLRVFPPWTCGFHLWTE